MQKPKVYELVMHVDKDWLDEIFNWLENKDLDAEENEVCSIISVGELSE